MNMMDMVMAMIAVVFFTTIATVYNRSMLIQQDNLNDATLVVQTTQICHSALDEIDALLFAKQLAFSDITTNYNFSETRNYDFLGTSFTVTVQAADCDSLGNILTSPPVNNAFKTVTVTVGGNAALRHSVSLTRMYTKTSMYI